MNICFISQNAFGALSRQSVGYRQVGGVQNQTALMTRWLAARGHKVSVIVWDEGQKDGLNCDGVTLYKMCSPESGLPGIRFINPRMTSLHRAMERSSADIYFHNAAEAVTGLVAAWCRWRKKTFIYSAAAELACDHRLPLMKKSLDRVLYTYGLRKANKIIVQTQKQKQLLQSGFGLNAVHLPMPCAGPAENQLGKGPASTRPIVLWVGRISPGKRLEWLLDVAEKCPEFDFKVVGANAETPYAQSLFNRASKIKNVIWVGTVPPTEMKAFYQESSCLCCTSAHEGFPNTFLESWSYGKPVVSTFDPDDTIQTKKLGGVAYDVIGLGDKLRELLSNPLLLEQLGGVCRNYFNSEHEVNVGMSRFEEFFLSIEKTLQKPQRIK